MLCRSDLNFRHELSGQLHPCACFAHPDSRAFAGHHPCQRSAAGYALESDISLRTSGPPKFAHGNEAAAIRIVSVRRTILCSHT